MRLVLFLCAVAALVPLFSVLGYVLFRGVPGLNLDFFTQIPRPVGEAGGGMANSLVGTCILVATASLLGIPWGIAAGVYLSEYGRTKTAHVVRFATDILASVPSIVIGLFIYALFVVPMGGFSALAGGMALGVLMIPTVARSTEEMLRLVPTHIREAGLALGLPRWKVILRVVLRGCVSAITTGVMLAIARVAGETAPLLFTALNNRFWSDSLTQPIASLPVQIYSYAIAPFEEWHTQAWAGALVLVLLVFVINIGSRVFFRGDAIGRE
ncbi:phosphate ABC transporter permease PstA [bacterium]|nr:phosphate ABC transporter permease PstA [bacterium]